MAETPQAVAYEEAVRAIDRQQSALDNLRSRSGTLLAAAAIVTSFLGAEALRDPGTVAGRTDRSVQLAEAIAIGAFVALALMVISILWPRSWTFSLSPSQLIGKHIEVPEPWTTEKLQRNLALWREKHFKANQEKLDRLLRYFRAGCFLLAVEVVAWLIDLM